LSDESLFREVDEEVRQEQFKKLWKRYGNVVIAGCVIVVAAVAGYKGYQYWQLRQSETAGEAFFSAVKTAGKNDTAAAIGEFKAITHAGYGVLARLRQAALLASEDKASEAVAIYDAVAADGSNDASLRDLARIRAALALADTATPSALETRVKDFDAPGNVWRHTAREIMASAQWRAGDYAATDTLVKAILADPEVPAGVRQRAQMLADLLVPLLAQK
jgi:hypothetical protein